MKAAIKLILFHMHGASTVTLRNQFLRCRSTAAIWGELRRHFLKTKTCWDHCSSKTANMHQEDIKGLPRPLLSSGQGVFCCFSCKNGALHPQDGNMRCTDGTMVRWQQMATSHYCLMLRCDGCLTFTTILMLVMARILYNNLVFGILNKLKMSLLYLPCCR